MLSTQQIMTDNSEEQESSRFTEEQKIVSAVWVHERYYNKQSWDDICNNFKIRFNVNPPMRSTLMSWERKLFNSGSVRNKEKSGRPLARLMHIPYVKASLKESPHLSLRERAKELGLPRTTLLKILQEDLNMEFDVEGNPNKKHAANNNGMWKKVSKDDDSSSNGEDKLSQITLLPKLKESLEKSPNLSMKERAEALQVSEVDILYFTKQLEKEKSGESPSKKIKVECEEDASSCD